MQPKFSVFIATSLDGFIAREDGSIDWLTQANQLVPEGEDCGYADFIASIDAILMGRKTMETVLAFDAWPYADIPVYILSRTLKALPPAAPATVQLVGGTIPEICRKLRAANHRKVYLDGGETIQSFLAANAVGELTITQVPILIGKGRRLFGELQRDIQLAHQSTQAYSFGFVQSVYRLVDTDES